MNQYICRSYNCGFSSVIRGGYCQYHGNQAQGSYYYPQPRCSVSSCNDFLDTYQEASMRLCKNCQRTQRACKHQGIPGAFG